MKYEDQDIHELLYRRLREQHEKDLEAQATELLELSLSSDKTIPEVEALAKLMEGK